MAKQDFIASEVIPIIQRENGITIESWEVCYLLNDELAALASAPLDRGVFYYGDVVIQGIDPFLGFVSFQNSAALAGDVNTLYTNYTSTKKAETPPTSSSSMNSAYCSAFLPTRLSLLKAFTRTPFRPSSRPGFSPDWKIYGKLVTTSPSHHSTCYTQFLN